MRKLLLAVLAVALIAAPAFASVQNIKISGSVDSEYLFRQNFDIGAADEETQKLFRSYVTIQLDADLSDNVSATVQLMNERVWDEPSTSTSETEIDLNLAYVTLREMLYSPMTVVVGRQNFPIGNKLYWDGGINGETASSIYHVTDDSRMDATDAIRFIFDYSPLTLQAFYAVADQNPVTLSSTDETVNVYGLVATYELGDKMQSMVEGTFLDKITPNNTAGNKTDSVELVGIRGVTHPAENMQLSLEYAHQGGTYAAATGKNFKRDAHAVQFIASYLPPILEDYDPMIQYSFTKLTGDNSHTYDYTNGTYDGTDDDTYTMWDSLYEGQGEDYSNGVPIMNDLFAYTNLVINQIQLKATPVEDVITRLTVTKAWQDKENTYGLTSSTFGGFPLLQPDEAAGFTTVDSNTGEKGIGLEINLDTVYNYTEDVEIGLNASVFKPGAIFKDKDSVKQIVGRVNVKF